MMDVCHEDFRGSVAVDARIRAISAELGVSFTSYAAHEAFYLDVALTGLPLARSWNILPRGIERVPAIPG